MAINIVDVSNLLHIGNSRFNNFSVRDVGGNEIKTGGIYMVMNLFRRKIFSKDSDIWVFCFDRPSFRKELSHSMGLDYKGNRTKTNPSIIMQSKELEKWLDLIGYNTLGVDGLESDDLISSIADMAKEMKMTVNIISTDRDLAYHVSDNCNLISMNSKVPSVTKQNYQHVVGGGSHTIAYNSILLYKVICGDKSDGVPPIAREPYSIYRKIINHLTKENFDLSKLSKEETIEQLIENLPQTLIEPATKNWQLIKPFKLPPEEIKLKPQTINLEEVINFSTIFGMKAIANKFGVDLGESSIDVVNYRKNLVEFVSNFGNPTNFDTEDETNKKVNNDVKERLKQIEQNQKLIQSEFSVNTVKPSISSDVDIVD